MGKTCFVVMPIADDVAAGYDEGHFKTVYKHLIQEACKKAGFEPKRADENNVTNSIALNIIKDIATSDMVVCDISNRNPNVLYELGVRHALRKPVTIIKDDKTIDIFDIQGQGIRRIEYDASLNIGKISPKIDELAENIENTYKNRNNRDNTLFHLFSNNHEQTSSSSFQLGDSQKPHYPLLQQGSVVHWNSEKDVGIIRSSAGDEYYFNPHQCVSAEVPKEGETVFFFGKDLGGEKVAAVSVIRLGSLYQGKIYNYNEERKFAFAAITDERENTGSIYIPVLDTYDFIERNAEILFTVSTNPNGVCGIDASSA